MLQLGCFLVMTKGEYEDRLRMMSKLIREIVKRDTLQEERNKIAWANRPKDNLAPPDLIDAVFNQDYLEVPKEGGQ